jgi:glycosyl transferase family 25
MKQEKIFLINLDASQERLASSSAQLAKQGFEFERISAVYGKSLPEAELHQYYCEQTNNEKFYRKLNAGEIGCYMSHRVTWQKIIEQDLDYALILEDDFELIGDLNEVFEAIEQLNFEWDLIKLSAYNSRERPIQFQRQLKDQLELVVHTKAMAGTCAQLISKKAAKKLLAYSNSFGRPIDTDIQHIWQTGVPVLSLMPYCFRQDMSFESDISASSNGQKVKKNVPKRIGKQIISKINNYFATHGTVKRLKNEWT